jgi:aminoglycoside phosphotransferase (APT) family kinase protein
LTDEVIDVRPGDELDWARLESYLRDHIDLPPEPMGVAQFAGGHANLTYLLTVGSWRGVLRRPPRGKLAPGAHDMRREYRMLSTLAPVYDRAPHVLHFCDDETVVGATFVIQEARVGLVVRSEVPPELDQGDDVVRRIDHAVLDAAVDLHAVDASDFDDVGRADGFGRRQVDGWLERWHRAEPEHRVPAMDAAAAELARLLPGPQRASVVHNDLKLDNCQFAPGQPDRVTAVFDWDMATVGDPLFDLGALLVSMRTSPLWVLTDDEAAARYGVETTLLEWYLAFATWRTAVVLQQLANRYRDGATKDERLARYAEHVPAYAERALELLQ